MQEGRKICQYVWAPWNSWWNPVEGARRFLSKNFLTLSPVPPTPPEKENILIEQLLAEKTQISVFRTTLRVKLEWEHAL